MMLSKSASIPACESSERKRVLWLDSLLSLAKSASFFIYLYSGYVQMRDLILARLGRARVVVLCYHRVGGCDVLTKPADEFRRDLDYLRSNYECISLAEICERLRANVPLRRRSVVVTFDDGYRDNYTQGVPLLSAAGIPATFFVTTGFIGTNQVFPHDARNAASNHGAAGRSSDHLKLTWDDLRAMEAAGFEVGSHTVNHTNLGQANEQTIGREVNDSLAALNRELGGRPRAFAFPWGKPGDISTAAVAAARQAGYYAALSAYGGTVKRGDGLFILRRVDAGNGHLSRMAWQARIAGFDPDYFRLKLKAWF